MSIKLSNLKRFKFGMKHLTPEQQLKVSKTSSLWGSVGLLIALFAIIYTLGTYWDWKMFGFAIFIFFMISMQLTQYRAAKQQLLQFQSSSDSNYILSDDAKEKIAELLNEDDGDEN